MSEYSYGYVVRVGDKTYNVLVRPVGEGRFKVLVENTELDVFVEGGQTIVKPQPSTGTASSVEPKTPAVDKAKPPSDRGSKKSETVSGTALTAVAPVATPTAPVTAVGGAIIASPIPGKVLKVLVSPGEPVNPGKLVATLESMKMEVEVFSDKSGRVKEVKVRPGDFVNVGDPLILLD
ncbi:MAG: biotin/lipoyl-containing protein [Sulfolobales archaeon]